MRVEDLKPILEMLNNQEARLVKKMDEIHTDVKNINGRLRRNENEVVKVKSDVDSINKKWDKVEPLINNMSKIQVFFKYPFKCIALGFLILFVMQIIIVHAYEYDWLDKIMEALKLIT